MQIDGFDMRLVQDFRNHPRMIAEVDLAELEHQVAIAIVDGDALPAAHLRHLGQMGLYLGQECPIVPSAFEPLAEQHLQQRGAVKVQFGIDVRLGDPVFDLFPFFFGNHGKESCSGLPGLVAQVVVGRYPHPADEQRGGKQYQLPPRTGDETRAFGWWLGQRGGGWHGWYS